MFKYKFIRYSCRLGGEVNEASTLPTPEQGCGYSKTANKRIVGGTPAKNGNIWANGKSSMSIM